MAISLDRFAPTPQLRRVYGGQGRVFIQFPPSDKAFRIHRDGPLEAMIYFHDNPNPKNGYGYYLVDAASIADGKPRLNVTSALLYRGCYAEGHEFICPVCDPHSGYPTDWRDSL
jgi:hypothetical protein